MLLYIHIIHNTHTHIYHRVYVMYSAYLRCIFIEFIYMYIYELYVILGMIIYSEMGFKYGVLLDS